jgi:hypothetical protein
VLVVTALLLTIALAVVLGRCPWPACQYLNLNTYTITTLDEYRRFLSNQAAFKALHRVAGVRLECSALRDDVVAALESGRLMLGLSESGIVQQDMAQPGLFHAWREGRVLHLVNNMLEARQDFEAWAAKVQETVLSQKEDELSYFPRLFGGLIIHIHNKQKPMVLFSDEPCS